MQDLRVIGVESGALLLATDGGSEYRLPVTTTLPAQVRQANPDAAPHKRVSPKDVQARIRGGATTEQVAQFLDVDVEYVRRFEGPVLAERAFILDAAQRVTVTPSDLSAPDVFGEAVAARLESGDATDVAWASWKHPESGWQVQVRYTVHDVEHDAQWRFDPKTSTLVPDNGDAHRLSHSDDDAGLAPRLRAVEPDHDEDPTDSTRFDSGAFRVDEPDLDTVDPEVVDRAPLRAPLPRIGAAPVEERAPGNETADLLEALRRRRGEREAASFGEQDTHRGGQISVVDIPLEGFDESDTAPQQRVDARPASTPETDGTRQERKKRSRRSMPSWDEIVFGTRPDDDLA